jgi:hypothetical protein
MNTNWIMTTGLLAAMTAVPMVRGQDVITPDDEVIEAGVITDGGQVATEVGSKAYGMGAFAHGVGEYNLNTARAVHEYQRARARAIQNHKLAVEVWFDLKRQNREFRARELDPLTPSQLSRVIEAQHPERLATWEYNPMTGNLEWPYALQEDVFETEREALEYAFSSRTSRDSGRDSAFASQIHETTDDMLVKLRDRIELLSPNEFGAAKKFLVGLRYEAQLPINARPLAMR